MSRRLYITSILVFLTAAVASGLLWLMQDRNQRMSRAAVQEEFQASKKAREFNQLSEVARDSIEIAGDFQACRLRRVSFYGIKTWNYPESELIRLQSASAESGCEQIDDIVRRTDLDEQSIKALERLGFVCRLSTPGLKNIWFPTVRARMLLQSGEIREASVPERGVRRLYKWEINTGCREIVSIENVSETSTGARVEFSWKWNVTATGREFGLTEDKDYARAYLRKTPRGYLLEKVHMSP